MKGKLTVADNNYDSNHIGDVCSTGNSKLNMGWFRSIPRRISKFIAKHNHRYTNQTDALCDVINKNEKYKKDIENDIDNDDIFYQRSDYYLSEELAMIRARKQMKK